MFILESQLRQAHQHQCPRKHGTPKMFHRRRSRQAQSSPHSERRYGSPSLAPHLTPLWRTTWFSISATFIDWEPANTLNLATDVDMQFPRAFRTLGLLRIEGNDGVPMEVGEELASRERWTRVMDAGKRMAHLRAGKTLHGQSCIMQVKTWIWHRMELCKLFCSYIPTSSPSLSISPRHGDNRSSAFSNRREA